MPRHVDPERRRQAIARAAIEVAKESGVASVSFRRVADRMGSSTTVVTHYVPTRGELLNLAFHHAFDRMRMFGEIALPLLPGKVALALIIEGTLPLRSNTTLAARLWFELVTESERQAELAATIAENLGWYRGEMRRIIDRLDTGSDPDLAVEFVVAVLDGLTLAALAEPAAWPARRQRRAAYQMLAQIGITGLRKPRDTRWIRTG